MSKNFDILEAMWLRREKKRRAQKTIEGVPPLTYTAKNAGTLKNYRIYGNTVDGESVGDRTGNLWDEGLLKNQTMDWSTGLETSNSLNRIVTDYISLDSNNYTVSVDGLDQCTVFFYDLSKQFINTTSWLQLPATFSSNDGFIRILFRKSNGEDIPVSDGWRIMLNSSSEPLPYEPYGYKLPITVTNSGTTSNETIYLPEQIRKAGDEAEYIDYAEQKQHFVGGTSVDVTLPALPTIAGTNTLSVGTQVQPSKVIVKGKLKE